jgi:hypothetical protein
VSVLQSHVVKNFSNLRCLILLIPVFLLGFVVLGSSSLPPGDRTELVRAHTRNIEFDYVGWSFDALGLKFAQSSLGTSKYLSQDAQHILVLEYLDLVTGIQMAEGQLNNVYADPNIGDLQSASGDLRQELEVLYAQREKIGPVAEGILQSQISHIVAEFGLGLGGQPVPPVLYHNTPLPYALIVSPRTVIRQDEDISLLPDLTVDKHVELEEEVDNNLDVSSLVVPIGGVGVYPTMVQETNNLDWLSEVVAHEWTHNFLSLRPLGINYFTSPELRVMNETTASIAGKEMGRAVLETFYPELVPPPEPGTEPLEPTEPLAFDFRAEMHETRLTVDELLAEGEIDEAESYMERRRSFFWEHGYPIRKLNQAYFAFYGAYADEPGGAAGAAEDPIGEAVRALRAQSPSLAAFLNRISWITSFEQLQRVVEEST